MVGPAPTTSIAQYPRTSDSHLEPQIRLLGALGQRGRYPLPLHITRPHPHRMIEAGGGPSPPWEGPCHLVGSTAPLGPATLSTWALELGLLTVPHVQELSRCLPVKGRRDTLITSSTQLPARSSPSHRSGQTQHSPSLSPDLPTILPVRPDPPLPPRVPSLHPCKAGDSSASLLHPHCSQC